MAVFKFNWRNFHQPLKQISNKAGHLFTPTVLLVADEVF